MNKSTIYNNIGAQLLDAGNYAAARDLFGAALEIKLAGTFLAVVGGQSALEAENAVSALKTGSLVEAERHIA